MAQIKLFKTIKAKNANKQNSKHLQTALKTEFFAPWAMWVTSKNFLDEKKKFENFRFWKSFLMLRHPQNRPTGAKVATKMARDL